MPPISHLAFADDLLLFAEASEEQAAVISRVLHDFCASSGQKVSMDKTRVYFSENVNYHHKVNIIETLGFQSTSDLGKYLGIPIFHHRVNKESFRFIIDKVNQRIGSWKAITLSLAGRVTLTKSVLQAMPTYTMQACIIHKGVCDDIDQICRGFIWGDEEGQRKVHSVSWNRICQPKKEGGLGLRNMRDLNTTFLMRASWKFVSPPDTLWQTILRGKYNTWKTDFPKIDTSKPGSNFWKGISKNWDSFRSNVAWQVGNGETVRFWEDCWLSTDTP